VPYRNSCSSNRLNSCCNMRLLLHAGWRPSVLTQGLDLLLRHMIAANTCANNHLTICHSCPCMHAGWRPVFSPDGLAMRGLLLPYLTALVLVPTGILRLLPHLLCMQVGDLVFSPDGLAKRGLLLRHLRTRAAVTTRPLLPHAPSPACRLAIWCSHPRA
jgi:hypothetical protein